MKRTITGSKSLPCPLSALLLGLFLMAGCSSFRQSDYTTLEAKNTHVTQKALRERNLRIVNGTGFFITDRGHLITNFHVAAAGKQIIVHHDDNEYDARIVKIDPYNDIALLKIEADTIPLPIHINKNPRKGVEVLTIGYPAVGLTGSDSKVTFGYINAISGLRGDIRFFQIDVPIQPGNSGGPLLNHYGEVIGITSGTINQLDSLEYTGSLTQNINYALKIDYIFPLLQNAGIRIPTSNRSEKQNVKTLIEESDHSIVMIELKN